MKRLLLSFVIGAALITAAYSAATVPGMGRIEYLEGTISVMRGGRSIGEPDIDTPLLSGDFIKTAKDGLVVIALDPATGMNGTLTVRANTALYLKLESFKGEMRTTVDLVAGSVGSKVKKLAGNPGMFVNSGSVIMGVRGTRYEIAVSVLESVMVLCTEGEVLVTDMQEQSSVPAGKAIEKRPGERFAYLPVAISSIEEFRSRWIAEEIEAFRSNPLKALASYEKRYSELFARFQAAFEPFQKSAVLRTWMEEDRSGKVPRPMDPKVMREKKEMAGYLMELRKILFLFERVYYRLDEVAGLVLDSSLENAQIKPNLKAGEFLRRFNTDKDLLLKRVFLIRYAEKLYELRNQDGSGFLGEDDFFGSDFTF